MIYIHADRGTFEVSCAAEQWWCTFLEVQKADLPDTGENPIFDFDIVQVNGTSTWHAGISLSCIPFEFTEVEPSRESASLELDEQCKLNSCLILDAAQLEQLTVQPPKTYTSDFFEDHALIFISELFPHTASGSPKMIELFSYDNVLEIAAWRNPAYGEDVEWWCTFWEVNKADLNGADENAFFHFYVYESDGGSSVRSLFIEK
jgi:hypothetical protein